MYSALLPQMAAVRRSRMEGSQKDQLDLTFNHTVPLCSIDHTCDYGRKGYSDSRTGRHQRGYAESKTAVDIGGYG